MKDVKRCVSTAFWKDDKVLNEFSPEDKYFMLYLLTNPHTSQLGIYHLPLKMASVELGYSLDAIRVLLDRFENKYNILRYSQATNEVAIKNYLRHSIVSGGKPVMDCLEKDYNAIKDMSLASFVLNYLNTLDTKYLNITVIEFIKKHINEINNDNDNERYVDESFKTPKTRAKRVTMYFSENQHLNTAFVDYLEMRKKIRKPASDRAIELVKKKLSRLSDGNDELAIDILNQSVLNSWQDVYPLKGDYKRSGERNTSNTREREERERGIDEVIRRIESGEADHDDDHLWDGLP